MTKFIILISVLIILTVLFATVLCYFLWHMNREKFLKEKAKEYQEGYADCEKKMKKEINALASNKARDILQGYFIQKTILFPPDHEKCPGVTVVHWGDGTSTHVKLKDGDTYDAEKGIAFCVLKKMYGEKFKEFLKISTNSSKDTE